MRRCRSRQREGYRYVGIDIHDVEIAELVARGYLRAAQRRDLNALARAIYTALDDALGLVSLPDP